MRKNVWVGLEMCDCWTFQFCILCLDHYQERLFETCVCLNKIHPFKRCILSMCLCVCTISFLLVSGVFKWLSLCAQFILHVCLVLLGVWLNDEFQGIVLLIFVSEWLCCRRFFHCFTSLFEVCVTMDQRTTCLQSPDFKKKYVYCKRCFATLFIVDGELLISLM